MPTKTLITPMDDTPQQICFADHAGDFAPTGANDLRATGGGELDVQLVLASLANSTGYRQSAKFDFGAHWALGYHARLAIELAATPTAGNAITVFLAPSPSATAGTANAANVSGSDSAYTGYSSNAANSVRQLQIISVFIVTAQATATVQVIEGWRFTPPERYGSIILHNNSGAAVHSDDVECHLVFDPIVPEFQN